MPIPHIFAIDGKSEVDDSQGRMSLNHKQLYELTELAEILVTRAPQSGTDATMLPWTVDLSQLVHDCSQSHQQILGLLPPVFRGRYRLALKAIDQVKADEWPTFPLAQTVEHLRSLAGGLGMAVERQLELQDRGMEPAPVPASALHRVERLLSRFHAVQKQMRIRQRKRPALVHITNEYDVQDLLHALLRIDFDDVRVEDWVPEYAGGMSRVDFVLKAEQIVIEVKFATRTTGAKEIGAQLIVDIGRYREHKDCKALVCFTYDPEGVIANPTGLRRDLEKLGHDTNLPVVVVVNPVH